MNPNTVLDLVRRLFDFVMGIIPPDVARDELEAAAIRRQNALADEAENLKFPGDTP